MGVIYKLLKHRRNFEMDLSTKTKLDAVRRLITLEYLEKSNKAQIFIKNEINGDEEEEEEQQRQQQQSQSQQQQPQQQINDEYLNQLYRFLAENALKKNALKHAAQQMPQMLSSSNLEAKIEEPTQTWTSVPILMDKVNTFNNQQVQKQQQQQPAQLQQQQQQRQIDNKRDILLKIRHQIFERKRQRQLAHVQQQLVVWRPW